MLAQCEINELRLEIKESIDNSNSSVNSLNNSTQALNNSNQVIHSELRVNLTSDLLQIEHPPREKKGHEIPECQVCNDELCEVAFVP